MTAGECRAYERCNNNSRISSMTKQKTYEGGCLCGNIRFLAMGPALKPHTCSCRICQRHSGALTQMWVEFSTEQVRWIGPGGRPNTWRSSDWSSRAFCSVCGSTIGAIDDKPTLAIALGTFDSPNRKELAPLFHSHVSKRPAWWGIRDPRES
jgi:hypothetical protein